MATYTVDTHADTVDPGDGVLSLREALALADANFDVDTVLFADAVQGGTIVLAGSQLTASSLDSIDGGTGVTIDADERSRVLLVQGDDEGGTLEHLIITGGRTTGDEDSGGGIRVDGNADLTLDHVTISGNSTAGKYAEGGGVAGDYSGLSYVTLINSTVSGNSTAGAYAAGGGVTGGTVSLTNSTVSGNSTAGNGAKGGGIRGFDVTLTNSTVSGNSTEGANYARGGGLYSYNNNITVSNSIVAGNTAAGSADPDVAGGIRASNGLNIFGSDVDRNAPSDRENVPPSLLFAGGLADNGGPTATIALRDAADNPALGRADLAYAPAVDQRGILRPQPVGTNPDIGAFELDQSAPSPPPLVLGAIFTVSTTSDISADDGSLTLREALALADADSLTVDRIEFAHSVQGQTIILVEGQLTANSDVTIDGGTGITIDANLANRVLLVQGLGTDLVARHLTITGGRASGDYLTDGGGGIRAESDATLTLDHATISGNSSAVGGGVYGYSVILTNSIVSGNSTTDSGGGIYGRNLTLVDSTVTDNTGAVGGGIYGYSVTLTNSTVSGNSTSDGGGGGIYGYSVTLTNSTVSGNRAVGTYSAGGGIIGAYVALTNSTVSGNSTAGGDGPGGGVSGNYVTLTNTILAGNTTVDGIGPDVVGYLFSNGHNIFGSDVEGDAGGDVEKIPSNLLFAGGLADNGGPTATIALRDAADNPALGRADLAYAPAADQRGVGRPQPSDTSPDIGAFELNQTAPPLLAITGTGHDDVVRGTAAADQIRGVGGNDRLWGLSGNDELFGGYGSDVLAGGPGIDQMTGGAGADSFLLRQPEAASATGPEYDMILDFSRAEHDRIDLQPIDARMGATGNQAFSFIGRHEFTRAGQLRFEATADGDFLVTGNIDRNLDSDFAFIVRTGLEQLRAADFLL